MINKLKQWILPKEIDFFKSLSEQSQRTLDIVEELSTFYTVDQGQDSQRVLDRIAEAKKNRSENLKELNSAFITPVDRESLSRAYTHLYWVALSIKHLIIEMDTYKIFHLKQYKDIFDLIQEELTQLTDGFKSLSTKDYHSALKIVGHIIHLDDELIAKKATHLEELFKRDDFREILTHREILAQLKEISKRVHICANLMEDIVFKIS